MRSKIVLTLMISFTISSIIRAQDSDSSFPKFKYHIWIQTTEGNIIKGVLLSTTDSSVKIYPGNFSDLKKQKNYRVVNQNYTAISDIYIKKRAGWAKGIAIGALIGLSPIIFGQAGAYVAIISFPVGILTGAIVGATARKKFNISSNKVNFNKFRTKVTKK